MGFNLRDYANNKEKENQKQNTETPSASTGGFSLREYANKQQQTTPEAPKYSGRIYPASEIIPQPKVNLEPNQYTTRVGYTDTASSNYSREDILRMLADAKVAQEQEKALKAKEAEEDAFRRGFGDAMLQGAGLPTTAAGSSPDMNVVKKGDIEAYTDAGTRKTSREDRLREQGVRDIVRENEAQPERTAYRYENMPSSQLRAEWQEKNDDAAIISELLGGNGQIVPLWVNESNFDSVYKPDNYNTEQIENARDIISKRKYIANKYNAQIVDDGEKYRDALNRVLDRIGGGNIAYRDANGNAVTYANLFYENENKEKAAAVRKDKKYAPIYAEAEQLDKDITFLDSVTNAPADAYQYNEGLADIEKRYGVTLRNNPTAATNSNLLADRNALDELWLRLNDKRDEDAAKLKEGGYDYGRMSEYTRRLADRERLAEDRARYEKMAEDYPVLTTIANLFSGFGQLIEGIDALVSGKGSATPGGAGSYVPMNTARANTKAFSESVNSTVSKKIEEDILDLTGSDTLAWLVSRGYSGVTSVATSLITMGTSAAMFGPAGEAIGLSLLGSGAGMNAMVDAAERGANNADAIFYGLAAGINEALFEKLSFDRFVKIKGSWDRNNIAKSIANWLWQSAKQGGVEASEEVFTDIANRIADNIINDKTSEYETDVARYKKQGLTTSEAQERAKLDFLEQVVESAYGGFIGGGASAATKSFANIMRDRAQEVRNIAPAKRAAKGNDIAKKIASGKELTTEEAKLVIADPKTSFAVQETTGIDFSGLAIKNGVYTNAYTPEQVKSILTDWYDNAVEGRATRVESPAQPMPRISLNNSIEQNLAALAQTPTAAETSEISTVSPAENASEGNFTSAELNARNAEITAPRADTARSWEIIGKDFGENGQRAFTEAYNPEFTSGELDTVGRVFTAFYNAGKNNAGVFSVPESVRASVNSIYANPNDATAMEAAAYTAGINDARLTTDARNDIIVSQETEGGNTYGRQGRELRVPRIGVRESVQSTREQGSGVSSATGENQEGRIDSRRGAESSRNGEQNARRVQEVQAGQKVSPKQLGLKYGTDKQNTVVTPSNETLKTANKLGVKVIAVKGALEMRGDDGKTFRVNGASFVDPETGKHTIVVQSDNPKYAERQILLHEATHEELRQGRVSRQEIHDTINELANSEEEVWELFNAYAREYGETYTEKQILDEIFCDAKAAMDRWGVKGAKKAMDSIRRAAGEVYEASRTAAVDKAVSEGKPISYNDEVDFSRAHDAEYMEAAQEYNTKHGTTIPVNVLSNAAAARKTVLDYMNAHEAELLLPEDIEGKNWFGNNSYGGTLESTTVCTRSLAAQTLMDMVSEQLGRPLTVKETLFLSQDMMNYTSDPECVYCYVAADRRAYREFLGEYIKQRDAALKDIKNGVSKQEAYERFLGTRKDTKNMRSRFNMWLNTTDLITAKDLASLQKLTFERNYLAGLRNKTEAQKSRYNQLKDAMAYAQSASWAKKMVGFTAYNGEILTWTQKRIDELNSHYGARMYSFSDFSPAFILENMQQVTDAAVRGLKMFSYNKAIDFVKIFAPTGMNFNVSVFGYEQNGQVAEDAMQGVPWKEAQELRAEYPGVGIVFVATNDTLVDWAKQQDWIDVVIPYHTVRTGKVVADFFGYKDYKQVQEDGKIPGVKYEKGAKKSIYPAEHQNDIVKYVKALDKYNLTPRFPEQITGWREFLDGEMTEQEFRDANPYYMKFVNETRRAPQDTPAVQPIFDADAAVSALEKMAKQGGYNPAFGGSIETMNELADEFAENIRRRNAEEDDNADRYSIVDDDGEVYRGLLISDKGHAYSTDITNRLKKGETRFEKDAFLENAYKTGERIALIRSGVPGKFAAYATTKIGKPEWISASEWESRRNDTRVPKGSEYDINGADGKWYYPFVNMRVLPNEVEPSSHSPKYGRFDDTDRFSRTDAEYLELAQEPEKNKAELQRMVDEAAKEAGYTTEVYHGTNTEFNSFDVDKSRFGNSGYGIYLGDKWKAAEYGGNGRMIRVYADISRVASQYGHDITTKQFQTAFSKLGLSPAETYKRYVDTASDYMAKRNDWNIAYDLQHWAQFPKWYGKKKSNAPMTPSQVLSILTETLNKTGMENTSEVVLWDNTLVKSADPVTYDDNGNVIPLSERFNSENDDIRFSQEEDAIRFNELFATLDDGRIAPKDVEALNKSDWVKIYKAVKKLGYDITSAEDAKEAYSDYVGESGFNDEQSEAIKRAFGAAPAAESLANPERVKAAEKEFGTTTDFREAGYLLPDGKMLDFSGKKEGGPARTRAMDHREISSVFDEDLRGDRYGDDTAYMNAFISEGNIRLMDDVGVTMGETEPTAQQYSVLERFIDRVTKNNNGYFYLDISNNKGYTIESREYEGDSASKILREIKDYYKNGELPYRSDLQQYRYSPEEGVNADLAAEFKALQRENAALRERLAAAKGQLKRTEQPTVRSDDVRKVARSVIKRYDSNANTDYVAQKMEDLGNLIVRGSDEKGDATYTRIKEAASDIMYDIIAGSDSVYDADVIESHKRIRDTLRATKLYVSPSERADAALGSDSYEQFRKKNFGTLNLSSDPKALRVDVFYQELVDQYPWMFDRDITSQGDMLREMVDVANAPLTPSYNIAEEAEVEADDLLWRLMGEEVRQVETFADKAARKQAQAVAHESNKLNAARDKIAALKEEVAAEKAKKEALRKQKNRIIEEIKRKHSAEREDARERKERREAEDRLLGMLRRVNNTKLSTPNRAWFEKYFGDIYTVAKHLTGNKLATAEDLQKKYAELKENDPDFIGSQRLEEDLAAILDKQKDVASMTDEEIGDYTYVLMEFLHQVQEGNKMTRIADRTDVRMQAYNVMSNVIATKGVPASGIVKQIQDATVTNALDALRAVRRYTGYNDSDPLYLRTRELAEGQRAADMYTTQAKAAFSNLLSNKKFVRFFAGPHAAEIEIHGTDANTNESVTLKITPALRTGLYLNNQNDDNRRHITYGGVVIPDIELLKKGKVNEAFARGTRVKFTPKEMTAITSGMTKEELDFARLTNSYFGEASPRAISEVYEELHGVPPKMVGAGYYPLKVADGWTRGNADTIDINAMAFDSPNDIGSPGWLKERKESIAPIYLFPADMVVNRSINDHGRYVGLAIPADNFNKLWEAKLYKKETRYNKLKGLDETYFAPDRALKDVIAGKWGTRAKKNINSFFNQILGRESRMMDTRFGRFRSRYARSVLELNPSVALVQMPSGVAAAAVVGYAPLAKAFNPALKIDTSFIDKMTASYLIRKEGYSQQELGELAQRGKKLPPALSWIIGADLATTGTLKRAAAFYVRDNMKELEVGSDAYKKAVVEVYDNIISETQPTYDVIYRANVLRSPSELIRALNMFRTQPYKNFNILYDALGNLQAKRNAYHEANRWAADDEQSQRYAEEAKAAYHDAKKRAVWAFTSQAASGMLISLIRAGWDMLRGKKKKYADEDGEVTFWSFLKGLGLNFASTGAGMVPYGGFLLDGVETLVDAVTGDDIFDATMYGFSVPEVDLLNDTASGVVDLGKALYKAFSAEEGADWKKIGRAIYEATEHISQFMGVPLGNARKTVEVMARQVFKAEGKYVGEYMASRFIDGDPLNRKSESYALLYKAKQSDAEQYNTLYEQMIKDGFKEDSIRNAMNKKIAADKGLESTTELANKDRYLSPSQQKTYDSVTRRVKSSEVWAESNAANRAKLSEIAYDVIAGSEKNTWKTKSITTENDLTQTEYILYKLALDIVDKPDKNGKYGSETHQYTDTEKKLAVKKAKQG